MANQKRNRLLALALALCLALGMLLPAGQVNAEGQSAGILTEVTGQEREQLASLADDTLALEEPTEASPAAEDDYPEGDPFAADPVDEPTRRINLNDLKFGRNYSGGDD